MRVSSSLIFRVTALWAVPLLGVAVGAGTAWAGDSGLESPDAVLDLSSSRTGSNIRSGLNLNTLVGANTFYNAGYTGTRAIVANIEAGYVWNGQESLTSVNTYISARATYVANGVDPGQLGEFDRHATWVGQTIAGRAPTASANNYARGIAYGATLWSGAIADVWTPNGTSYSTGFNWSKGWAYTEPYTKAMSGINGKKADVINSSWGFGDPAGSAVETQIMDGLINKYHTTVVFSAGNSGPGTNTVGGPGSGYNAIVVGAAGNDLGTPAYSSIAGFSSRGPSDYSGPDGNVSKIRARVDIVAPGQNMTLAFYGGKTGGNFNGASEPGSQLYSGNLQGTSFAAPTVAGGATLLADVGHDKFANNIDHATDGEVIKAVLLNSADNKVIPGWNNGQTTNGGVVKTKQALDFTQGAGRMDLNRAYTQYTAGVTDVPGLAGGTSLAAIGWDYGIITDTRLTNDYFLAGQLVAGTNFTATLNWFVDRVYDGTSADGNSYGAHEVGFTNLALQLWNVRNGQAFQMVMESDTDYLNTEHFSSSITTTDRYLLRVRWQGSRYGGDIDHSQTYGLAWSGISLISAAAPEPATIGFLMLGVGCWTLRARRKRIVRTSSV